MKLRAYLLSLVIAIAVPLVFFAALAIYLVHEREDRALRRNLGDTARAMALAIDREIEASVSTLQALGASKHLEAGNFAEFYEESRRVRAVHEGWGTIFLADARGREIFGLLVPLGMGLPNIGGDPEVIEARRTGRPYVSDLLIGPISGRPVVRVLVPVKVRNRVRYLLAATLDPTHLTRVLARQPMSSEFLAMVLDRKGTTVARTRDSAAWVGHAAPPALLDLTRRAREGFDSIMARDGKTSHVAFSRVPGLDFTVAVAVPPSAIATGWFWVIAIGTILGLIGSLTCAVVMADRISEPMLALARAALAFGRGETPTAARASAVAEVEVVRRALGEAGAVAEERVREHAARLAAEAARREADAANRAKDQFLATLSHELRTPLQSMLGWIQIIRSGRLDDEKADRALETIERNARVQAQLIDDLLDISRIVAGKIQLEFTAIDLVPVIEAAIDSVRAGAEAKGVRLEARLDAVPGLAGDADRLQQVVWNLLSNAAKFTPRGGRIDVRLEQVEDQARISVTDTGKGIDPAFLPHIFERFRQADSTSTRTHGGLGIGLAIVRHFVELHGGTVRAESEGEARGSTFVVELPITAAASAPPPEPPARDRQPRVAGPVGIRGLHVLVVDDDPNTCDLLRTILGDEGARVVTATSVAEALESLERETPDVLVSDISMPVEDGYALIQRVRARKPDRGGLMPALALTAYARTEDRERALTAGYQTHVAKPVAPVELVEAVAKLAGRATAR